VHLLALVPHLTKAHARRVWRPESRRHDRAVGDRCRTSQCFVVAIPICSILHCRASYARIFAFMLLARLTGPPAATRGLRARHIDNRSDGRTYVIALASPPAGRSSGTAPTAPGLSAAHHPFGAHAATNRRCFSTWHTLMGEGISHPVCPAKERSLHYCLISWHPNFSGRAMILQLSKHLSCSNGTKTSEAELTINISYKLRRASDCSISASDLPLTPAIRSTDSAIPVANPNGVSSLC
jgi:hypothetical protein